MDDAVEELVACVADLNDLTQTARYPVDTIRRDQPRSAATTLPLRLWPQVQGLSRQVNGPLGAAAPPRQPGRRCSAGHGH